MANLLIPINADRMELLAALRQVESQLAYQNSSTVAELRQKLKNIQEIASFHLKNN